MADVDRRMDPWLEPKGLSASGDDWTIHFTLSNVPTENWFYKRNRLRPEDLKLTLDVPQWGLWRLQLERHDRLFVAQWRPAGFFVDSQQLRYRKLIQWPTLAELDDFPLIVDRIAAALDVDFLRHVNVGARYIGLENAVSGGSRLSSWLAPCADSLGVHSLVLSDVARR